MRHWGLLRKVNGNTSSGHNYFFYNGFDKITDLDNSPWGAGSSFGLKPVKSAGVLGTVHTSPSIQVFADNPNFRGTWYGTNKLFLNAIFLGNNISVPSN